MINMVSYLDWLLGTVAMLSQAGSKDDQNELQCLLVLGDRCLTNVMRNFITLYASIVQRRCDAVLTQFFNDVPSKTLGICVTFQSLKYQSAFPWKSCVVLVYTDKGVSYGSGIF